MKSKFSDKLNTLDGKQRAYVDLDALETLWLNTGSLCNLACSNCYIESTPKNDKLSYLNLSDVSGLLEEINSQNFPTKLIGITGGEPFLNKEIIAIINLCLVNGFEVLVLTNAFNVIDRHKLSLIKIQNQFKDKFHIRVSLDHYSKNVHEEQRGTNTFNKTLANIKWLFDNNFNLSIAGRSLSHEHTFDAKKSYLQLFRDNKINIQSEKIVIFPEMDLNKEVPEISIGCWDILKKTPQMQMCSSERMIVKRKGQDKITVLPCTLIAYDESFDLGHNLAESEKRVYLNHKFCAQFCVLGGGSCSSTK